MPSNHFQLAAFAPGTPASPLFLRLSGVLEENAPVRRGMDPKLRHAICAVLTHPGSLFRAELAFLTARACGLPEGSAEGLACAAEYFHVASLLFDDLPFMDDASSRRGLICTHLLHGEGAAVLAALALITRAYALLGAAAASAPAGRQGAARALVESCLGSAGMLDGQARDLHFQAGGGHDAREASAIALAKTVPLIQLALLLPALLGGAAEAERQTLRRVSVYWGLFYQGIDDLKDILEPGDAIGKPARQDQRLGRPNLARQLGLNQTARHLQRLERAAAQGVAALAQANQKFDFLQTYHQVLATRLDRFATLA